MAAVTDGPPELFAVRNALYLGNYSTALNKAQQTGAVSSSSDLKIQKDALMYRAYIGLGEYETVLNQIDSEDDSTHVSLKAVRFLALYLRAVMKNGDKRVAIDGIEEILQDPVQAQDSTVLACAATIYLHEDNDSQVLKLVDSPGSLELASIQVKTLLKMNRIDLADQALRHMTLMNDDATITQLTSAYVSLSKGGHEAINEAQSLLEQMQRKFGNSTTVLNGLALCMIKSGAYENAEKTLLTSLGLSSASASSSPDPDTLINLIVCAQYLNKPQETIHRYMTQLQTVAPNHPWFQSYQQMDSEFDQLSSTYYSA